jgi:hypothetical protein
MFLNRCLLAVPLAVVLLLAGTIVESARAQGPTRVTLESIGRPSVEDRAAAAASDILTALNRAVYLDETPGFSDESITPAGREAIERRWNRAPFDCPEPRLRRRLSFLETGGYVLRGIPLLVREPDGGTSEREGVLLFSSSGVITGFAFGREYTPPTPPAPEPEPTPLTGTITITTSPNGAAIELLQADDPADIDEIRPRQRTSPARFENLPPGDYSFTIRLPEHRTIADTTFAVRPGVEIQRFVQLDPTVGALALAGLQPESTVRLNGEVRTVVRDAPLDVRAGEHRLQIAADYFEPMDTTITVPRGETVRIDGRLSRKQVPLRVRSDPGGATVRLSGRSVGTTPFQTTLDAGRSYVLRLEADGHLPTRRRELFAAPDSSVEEVYVLVPVTAQSEVGGAQISNVRLEREGEAVRVRYDLDGEPGEEYEVQFAVFDGEEKAVSLGEGRLRGAWGKGQRPGLDRQIAWQGPVPDGGRMELTVVDPGSNRRLWYVLGGAAAAGIGSAIVFLGGGDSGTASDPTDPTTPTPSFPPPPGLPGGN